jgi:carbonic anhydrase
MKQMNFLTLFIIFLILYNQEVHSSLANTKTNTKTETNSKTETNLKTKTETNSKTETNLKTKTETETNLKTQLKSNLKSKAKSKSKAKGKSTLKANAKAKSKSKAKAKAHAKAKSNNKEFETDYILDIPGFSSNPIGSIIAQSEKEYENEEENLNKRESYRLRNLPLNQDHDSDFDSDSNSNYSSDLNMIETNANLLKPYMKESDLVYQDWFSISSLDFSNTKKFPLVDTEDGEFNIDYDNKIYRRINPKFKFNNSTIPNKNAFYFRLSKYLLWYSFDNKEINIVGRIKVREIQDVRYIEKKKEYCFNPIENSKTSWTICGKDKNLIIKWFCKILKLSKLSKDDKCDPKKYLGNISPGNVVIKTITQPLIIIPTAAHMCNAGWSYQKKGVDWECMCKEGMEQSPIDLPPIKLAIETDARPVFEYKTVQVKMATDYEPAKLNIGDNNVIRYEKEALRIKHPNFGKIVTLDGAVYFAEEIVFHTPSEHTKNGKRFEMEMQIIHHGKSVGDTLKSVILSFLFKARPGSFNKFIDKLDFFDLPNPIIKAKELSKALFIPQILQDSNEEDLSYMLPFSFYTYQGSHTAPPCAEKTIHYVASQPIDLSNTALEMFKESLRIPDQMDSKGNVHVADFISENYRVTQPLNGRAIFHYDHKNDCPDFRKPKQGAPPTKGHYEKVVKDAVKYFHVNGVKPSGIPNAFVVTNKEAKGKLNG